MSNFYGGKEGRSFVIVKEYQTVSEMVDKFKLGPSYTEVNFDEYVLINTVNKANPENGQVFRRGYDFDSDRTIKSYNLEEKVQSSEKKTFINRDMIAGGAIYVGTIVGPAGKAPTFNFGAYDDIKLIERVAEIDGTVDTRIEDAQGMIDYLREHYPEGYFEADSNGEPVNEDRIVNVKWILHKTVNDEEKLYYYYFHYDKLLYESNPEYSLGWYQVDTPPKVGEDKFRPGDISLPNTVDYQYEEDGSLSYSIDEEGNRHLIISKRQDSIDWVYISIRNENNEDSTAYVGFKIPVNMVEYEAKSVSPYYNRSDEATTGQKTNNFDNLNLVYRDQTKEDIEAHPFYSKWNLSIPKGIKGEAIKNVRVVDAASVDAKSFILDAEENLTYNNIGEIQVEDYPGKVDDVNNHRKIIVYDYYYFDRIEEGDHFIIYLGDFNKIDEITFDHDGTFTLDYSHDDTVIYRKLVHWIDNMQFDEDGTVTVTFNDLDWDNGQIAKGILRKPYLFHWITDMDFQEDGSIRVVFNNTDITQGDIKNGVIDLPQFINWLTMFEISESGDIDIEFNNTNLTDIHLPNYIKKIDSIILQDTGNPSDNSALNNQKIRVTYNTKADNGVDKDTEEISNPINYVMRVERDDSTNHLLLLHSDPARRAQNSTSYDGINGWQDLGGLGYIMVHPDDNSAELVAKQNALSVGGVWFVTKEV